MNQSQFINGVSQRGSIINICFTARHAAVSPAPRKSVPWTNRFNPFVRCNSWRIALGFLIAYRSADTFKLDIMKIEF